MTTTWTDDRLDAEIQRFLGLRSHDVPEHPSVAQITQAMRADGGRRPDLRGRAHRVVPALVTAALIAALAASLVWVGAQRRATETPRPSVTPHEPDLSGWTTFDTEIGALSWLRIPDRVLKPGIFETPDGFAAFTDGFAVGTAWSVDGPVLGRDYVGQIPVTGYEESTDGRTWEAAAPPVPGRGPLRHIRVGQDHWVWSVSDGTAWRSSDYRDWVEVDLPDSAPPTDDLEWGLLLGRPIVGDSTTVIPMAESAPLPWNELLGVEGEPTLQRGGRVVIDGRIYPVRVEQRGSVAALVDADTGRDLLALDGVTFDLGTFRSGLQGGAEGRVERHRLLVVEGDRVEAIEPDWAPGTAVGWTGERFVAVRHLAPQTPDDEGGGSGVWESTDGRTWSHLGLPEGLHESSDPTSELLDGTEASLSAPLVLIRRAPGAVDSVIYGSDDGQSWRQLSATAGAVFSLERGLVSIRPPDISHSDDGVAWTEVTTRPGAMAGEPWFGAPPYRAGPETIVVPTEPGVSWLTWLLRFEADR
jgi:hypothetical protein